MKTTRQYIALVAVSVLAFGAAACGDDDDDSTSPSETSTVNSVTPATASPELCEERDNLKQSIADLSNVVQEGTSAIDPAVDKISENLRALKDTAKSDFRNEIDAFETSLSDLGSAIEDVGSDGGVSAVAQAVAAVGRTGSALVTSLDSLKC
jgi:hypothetical protein